MNSLPVSATPAQTLGAKKHVVRDLLLLPDRSYTCNLAYSSLQFAESATNLFWGCQE